MPYEYRKMTPQEKEETLRLRIEHGYPLHAPPHPIRDEGYHLITVACYEHNSIINSYDRRNQFETRLLNYLQKAQAEVVAWVVLPNHYHFLAWFNEFQDISNTIKGLNGETLYKWNQEDGCTGQRKIWYRYSDHYIRSERQILQAFNYIHYNPVKHRYADSPYDWVWSSLNLYLQDHGREWLCERWKKYTLGGWDYE